MHRSFAIVATLAAASTLFAACSSDALSDPDEDVASTEQGLLGEVSPTGLAGVVLVTLQGDPATYTGVLLAPNLVVADAIAFGRQPPASQVTVEVGIGPGRPVGTVYSVAELIEHPNGFLIYMRLNGSVPGRFTPTDTREFVPPNTDVACYAYEGRTLKRAKMTVQSSTETFVRLSSTLAHHVQLRDVGAPCVELGGAGSVVGVVYAGDLLLSGKLVGDFGPRAVQLFPIAAQSGRFMLKNGNGDCATIPHTFVHAIVDARPCVFGDPKQLFYFDYRVPTGPAIVNALSAMCLDVWDNSPVSGQPIQLYPCHHGRNQSFGWFQHNPAGNGLAYVSGVVPFTSTTPISSALRCLSARPTRTLDSSACITGTMDNKGQRWSVVWY